MQNHHRAKNLNGCSCRGAKKGGCGEMGTPEVWKRFPTFGTICKSPSLPRVLQRVLPVEGPQSSGAEGPGSGDNSLILLGEGQVGPGGFCSLPVFFEEILPLTDEWDYTYCFTSLLNSHCTRTLLWMCNYIIEL